MAFSGKDRFSDTPKAAAAAPSTKNNPKKGLGVTSNDLWQERNAASTAAFLHLYTIGQMRVKQSRFLCGQYYRSGKVLLESQDDTREDLLLIPYSQPF